MRSEPAFKPIGNLEQVAATCRSELARTYLIGSAVQSRMGMDATTVTAWRIDKRLLGVWHEPIEDWLYPDFQFDDRGLIGQFPAILASFDRYHSHVWANTWGIVEWFTSAHALLDGCRPMDILTVDPERVLCVAQQDLWEDPATLW